jgi:myosin-crossreactive antigen
MKEFTGAEILEEVLQTLPLTCDLRQKIRSEVIAAILVMLPYTDAHFLPRTYEDRPIWG